MKFLIIVHFLILHPSAEPTRLIIFFSKHFSIKMSQRHFQLPTASDAASYTWAENVMIIKIERNHSHFKLRNTLGEISSVLLLVK